MDENLINQIFPNVVRISLDGRMRSAMNWKKQQEQAKNDSAKGLKIFWHLNLGLFSALEWPLTNETQFQAFVLALEYFRDTLWAEFKETTLGLCLYCGSADFSQDFPWDEQQEFNYKKWLQRHQVEDLARFRRLFCGERAGEYLKWLANALPDSLSLFAVLDVKRIKNPLEMAQITSKERFERIHLIFEGQKRSLENIAICLPDMALIHPSHYEGMETAFEWMHQHKIPFRVIPESMLINEWDGLDFIIFSPKGLSSQGKRKLQGFCAAGGMAVSTEDLIGLPDEIKFLDWILLR